MRLGNAPCSWGVEFADDPRNPPWEQVLEDCSTAGFQGIELGPVGFLPEDPDVLKAALDRHGLTLAGGVVYQPFHDKGAWDAVRDAHLRTCRSLAAHGADQLILIDAIAADRADTLGRPDDARRLTPDGWAGFVERIRMAAEMAAGDYGLTVSIHAHAGGYCDFEEELDRVLEEIDADTLKVCMDTAAGMDPLAVTRRYADRISHIHLKDIDPVMKDRVIAERIEFYTACAENMFCEIGKGEVDFAAFHDLLVEIGYGGWCVVEQDCAPDSPTSKVDMAAANRRLLKTVGF